MVKGMVACFPIAAAAAMACHMQPKRVKEACNSNAFLFNHFIRISGGQRHRDLLLQDLLGPALPESQRSAFESQLPVSNDLPQASSPKLKPAW